MSRSQVLRYIMLAAKTVARLAVGLVVHAALVTSAVASGGFDNGSPAGKGRLTLDFTVDPGVKTRGAQSYVVWGYGLTEHADLHGYLSHESAAGVNQGYAGFLYNFLSDRRLDLSTAIGARHRTGLTDLFFPQLLYTIRIAGGFDVIGSVVNVHRVDDTVSRGIATDVAFRTPAPYLLVPPGFRDVKFALGAFRGLSGRWAPTYSIDCRF